MATPAPLASAPEKKPPKLPPGVPIPLLQGPLQVTLLKPPENRLVVGLMPVVAFIWYTFVPAALGVADALILSAILRFTKSAVSRALLRVAALLVKREPIGLKVSEPREGGNELVASPVIHGWTEPLAGWKVA